MIDSSPEGERGIPLGLSLINILSVTEQMASAIQETAPERFERLKQRIHNVTESIGNSLLPTVNDVMSKMCIRDSAGTWSARACRR